MRICQKGESVERRRLNKTEMSGYLQSEDIVDVWTKYFQREIAENNVEVKLRWSG